MLHSRQQNRLAGRRGGGFTLIEAALVTSIIGLGVTAMLQLIATGTASNAGGSELTIGMNLARNVREMSMGLYFTDPNTPTRWGIDSGESAQNLVFNDVNDLDGAVFSPVIDARRQPISSMEGWEQWVSVQNVSPDWLTLDSMSKGSTDALRVTVRILHHGREVCSLSWLVLRTQSST